MCKYFHPFYGLPIHYIGNVLYIHRRFKFFWSIPRLFFLLLSNFSDIYMIKTCSNLISLTVNFQFSSHLCLVLLFFFFSESHSVYLRDYCQCLSQRFLLEITWFQRLNPDLLNRKHMLSPLLNGFHILVENHL